MATDDAALDAAESTPVEDRVYPRVGDPGVDALHYDLDLTWAARLPHAHRRRDAGVPRHRGRRAVPARPRRPPRGLGRAPRRRGRGVRPCRQGPRRPGARDRRPPLHAGRGVRRHAEAGRGARPPARTSARSAGRSPATTRPGRCRSRSAPTPGTPSTTSPPTRRSTTSRSPRRRRCSGSRTGRWSRAETDDGTTVTRWHLDEPAASYLVTVAIGDFEETRDRSESGVPVTYWTPRDRPRTRASAAGGRRRAGLDRGPARAVPVLLARDRARRLAQRHGDADDDHAGRHRLHDLARGDRPRDGPPVVRRPGHAGRLARRVDERGHGDVPPVRRGRPTTPDAPLETVLDRFAPAEPLLRREAGPPADYDPATFGEGNVYYSPALMWHELRERLGERGVLVGASGPGRRRTRTATRRTTTSPPGGPSAPARTSPRSSTPGCSARRPRPRTSDPSLVHASARRPVACSRVSAPTRRLFTRGEHACRPGRATVR